MVKFTHSLSEEEQLAASEETIRGHRLLSSSFEPRDDFLRIIRRGSLEGLNVLTSHCQCFRSLLKDLGGRIKESPVVWISF